MESVSEGAPPWCIPSLESAFTKASRSVSLVSIPSIMRRIVALLLLLVQLQPLAGSALCLASVHPGRTDHQMAGMHQGMAHSRPAGGTVLDEQGAAPASTGCPLVQACAPLVIAVLASAAPRTTPDVAQAVAIRAAGPMPALEGRAPPTPPPNL